MGHWCGCVRQEGRCRHVGWRGVSSGHSFGWGVGVGAWGGRVGNKASLNLIKITELSALGAVRQQVWARGRGGWERPH